MAEFQPEFNVGDVLAGQQYDPRKNIFHPFTQEMLPQSSNSSNVRVTGEEGNAGTELTPQDANQTLERIYDIAAIQAELLELVYQWYSESDLQLPDVLTGITIFFSASAGSGTNSHPAANMTSGFTGGGTVVAQPRSTAQGSAAVMPDIQPAISSIWSRNIPTNNYAFYFIGTATLEQILARVTQIINPTPTTVTISNASPAVVSGLSLANGSTVLLATTGTLPAPLVTTLVYYVISASGSTFEVSLTPGGSAINTTTTGTGTHSAVSAVLPLPVFKTQIYTITAVGQQISVSATADSYVQLNAAATGSSYGYSSNYGSGSSQEVGVSIRSLRVGPVINGAITINSSGTNTETVSATVDASTPDVILNGSTVISAIGNTPTPISGTVTGSFSPSSISPTSVPAIPTSGLYLVNSNASIDDFGSLMVHAAVVNFAVFA